MNRRIGMPSPRAILLQWDKTALQWLKGFDSLQDMEDACFACGWTKAQLARCHIVPLCDGGSNHASNLVLMCRDCHHDSEGLPQTAWWAWFWSMSMGKAVERTMTRFCDVDLSAISTGYPALLKPPEGRP